MCEYALCYCREQHQEEQKIKHGPSFSSCWWKSYEKFGAIFHWIFMKIKSIFYYAIKNKCYFTTHNRLICVAIQGGQI